MMKIAFIGGTGNLGYGLALRCAKAGEYVLIGSRDAAKAEEAALRIRDELKETPCSISGVTNKEAAEAAEVIVIALPYAAHSTLLPDLADSCKGKTVLDVTVPMAYGKPPIYTAPETGSAAEGVQSLLPEAKVVSGLHTVSAASLAEADRILECDALVCGNDEEAKQMIIDLFTRFIPRILDIGALSQAQSIERLTPLVIALNQKYKRRHTGIRFTNI